MLWFCIWTPYAIVTMVAQFGNPMLVTPLVAQLPSFFGQLHDFVLKGQCREIVDNNPQFCLILLFASVYENCGDIQVFLFVVPVCIFTPRIVVQQTCPAKRLEVAVPRKRLS